MVLGSASSWGQVQSIDPTSSKLTVRAFKSGLFSGFADNHEIEAPIAEGTIDEARPRVKFTVDSQRMRVLDPHLAPNKRQQVQERMLGPEVLASTSFPEITFQSTSVEPRGQNEFLVRGDLSLRGVTHPVTATVLRNEAGRYTGMCTLKQRDFGIKPISIAGGTVKVKDELKIDFDIRTRAASAQNQ
jgi:polyisoprenoid-binding protein YceI